MAAVHGLEDPVRPGLHRQVKVGHELGQVGMGGDQVVVHVPGMAGGVADPVQALDPGQLAGQAAKAALS